MLAKHMIDPAMRRRKMFKLPDIRSCPGLAQQSFGWLLQDEDAKRCRIKPGIAVTRQSHPGLSWQSIGWISPYKNAASKADSTLTNRSRLDLSWQSLGMIWQCEGVEHHRISDWHSSYQMISSRFVVAKP
jgi:hypothetical protein